MIHAEDAESAEGADPSPMGPPKAAFGRAERVPGGGRVPKSAIRPPLGPTRATKQTSQVCSVPLLDQPFICVHLWLNDFFFPLCSLWPILFFGSPLHWSLAVELPQQILGHAPRRAGLA